MSDNWRDDNDCTESSWKYIALAVVFVAFFAMCLGGCWIINVNDTKREELNIEKMKLEVEMQLRSKKQ